MGKERKLLEFSGVFNLDAAGLGMRVEQAVFIRARVVGYRIPILESLKLLHQLFGAEDLHE